MNNFTNILLLVANVFFNESLRLFNGTNYVPEAEDRAQRAMQARGSCAIFEFAKCGSAKFTERDVNVSIPSFLSFYHTREPALANCINLRLFTSSGIRVCHKARPTTMNYAS